MSATAYSEEDCAKLTRSYHNHGIPKDHEYEHRDFWYGAQQDIPISYVDVEDLEKQVRAWRRTSVAAAVVAQRRRAYQDYCQEFFVDMTPTSVSGHEHTIARFAAFAEYARDKVDLLVQELDAQNEIAKATAALGSFGILEVEDPENPQPDANGQEDAPPMSRSPRRAPEPADAEWQALQTDKQQREDSREFCLNVIKQKIIDIGHPDKVDLAPSILNHEIKVLYGKRFRVTTEIPMQEWLRLAKHISQIKETGLLNVFDYFERTKLAGEIADLIHRSRFRCNSEFCMRVPVVMHIPRTQQVTFLVDTNTTVKNFANVLTRACGDDYLAEIVFKNENGNVYAYEIAPQVEPELRAVHTALSSRTKRPISVYNAKLSHSAHMIAGRLATFRGFLIETRP